jgi:hypothetical protein
MAFAGTAGDNTETYAKNVYLVCPALVPNPTSPKGTGTRNVLGDLRVKAIGTDVRNTSNGEVD